jgi:hypothetical protein
VGVTLVLSSLLWGSQVPSVVRMLEQRELGARRRVDELREEADRIQAELAVAPFNEHKSPL